MVSLGERTARTIGTVRSIRDGGALPRKVGALDRDTHVTDKVVRYAVERQCVRHLVREIQAVEQESPAVDC
jgi:hypothetical protein